MKQKMNDNIRITNFTKNGECSNCGQCCGDILHLSKKEIKIIDNYLKKHEIKATSRCIFSVYDNTCPFRDNKNKKCKIYEVRPDICKVYKCDKTPEEAIKNRELTNFGKLPRSMRNLFFNDDEGAKRLNENFGITIFDRNDRVIKVENDRD